MRLSYNGWPPIVSHFACLIAGVAASNFFIAAEAKKAHYLIHHATIPLAQEYVVKTPLPKFAEGEKIWLSLEGQANQAPCRFALKTVLFLKSEPVLILGIRPSDIPTFSKLLIKKNKQRIKPIRLEAGSHLVPCDYSTSRISYGSSET